MQAKNQKATIHQFSQLAGAVIFDVDGVLVDSYDAHLASWQRVASETNVTFTAEQFAHTFGRTSREIIRLIWPPEFHGEEAVNCLDDRKEHLYRELVSSSFPSMDGATDLIHHLHRSGLRLALGSSGPKENVELAVRCLQIGSLIDAIVTGADVVRGKPDPEVFLLAAKRLGTEPHHCVVIEDAPAGIQAARAAGMRNVAFLSRGRSRADFVNHSPDAFIASLHELSADRLLGMIEANH